MPRSDGRVTIAETVRRVRAREISVVELVSSYLDKIERYDKKINAFITTDKPRALSRAKEIDQKVRRREHVGSLAGIPLAVKDNISTRGIRTTCGSKMLENYVPPYNATAVDLVLAEGAIILGKTNMDEFGMGTNTENSYFGPTRNPLKLDRVAGGSSGGSAAAIKAGMSLASLGEDTGGSIRCPASYCGVVGLKPSYGLVSRYGLVAYAHSLDQIGPMGTTVEDCAMLLDVIAGHDPLDGTSAEGNHEAYSEGIRKGIKGLKIGLPTQFFAGGTKPAVAKLVRRAVSRLAEMGAKAEETSLASLDAALASYYVIATAEASSNLARFDGVRYGYAETEISDWESTFIKNRSAGFGAEVKRRILLGTYVLSAGYFDEYYIRALRVRGLIRQQFEAAFKKFDLLVGPTMPTPPPKIGEKKEPLEIYSMDVNTVPSNLTGLPALSVPCGEVGGLPVGMQIFAPMFNDVLALRAGKAYETIEGRA